MFSVIVPVYNGENFINSCYESLCLQTYNDWEAIFIDDGSTDRSLEVLTSISEADERVEVFHKENAGVAIAREVGINKAKGEFVTFLDVDDTLTNSALEEFAKHFDSEETDIVIGGINMVSVHGKLLRSIYYNQITLSGIECVDMMCTGLLRWQLCGKAFKKSIVQKTLTPKGLRSAEDMAVCLQASLKAKKVSVISSCLYNYVQVESSVTHSKAREISHDALESTRFIERTIGNEIDPISLDCLYLLIISSSLRAGITVLDSVFRHAIKEHGSFKAIRKLPLLKALNVVLYRYLNINLARFL